ncbi:MAG: hypothetical protein GY868_14910 [Deltaproteobacteria bacterium]|nr:hypothetical protein [Deltaproteobacteria bacterium]
MQKALFLINPVSGQHAGTLLKEQIDAYLQELPDRSRYDTAFTDVNVGQQMKELSSRYETLVVAGGDGTLSEVVQGLRSLGYAPKIGLIPLGTGNDLAGSLGISACLKKKGLPALLDVIITGKTFALDSISINRQRLFTNYFGLGNDAKTAMLFSSLRSRPGYQALCSSPLRKAVYCLLALTSGGYRIPFDLEFAYRTPDGSPGIKRIPAGAHGLIISNAKTYAGGMQFSSLCCMNDRLFEVTVITGTLQRIMMPAALLSARPLNRCCPGLLQFQTDSLQIALRGETFYQIDGEAGAALPREMQTLDINIDEPIDMIVP